MTEISEKRGREDDFATIKHGPRPDKEVLLLTEKKINCNATIEYHTGSIPHLERKRRMM